MLKTKERLLQGAIPADTKWPNQLTKERAVQVPFRRTFLSFRSFAEEKTRHMPAAAAVEASHTYIFHKTGPVAAFPEAPTGTV
jgi:hypothetical protein